MKIKPIKKIASIGLSILFFLSTASTSYAAAPAKVTNKTEVLYANLAHDGSVDGVYAVNQFSVATEGIVTDYGDYSSVLNLSNTASLTQSGDAVTFEAQKGTFYYQGNLTNTNLPWQVSIDYSLDGQSISPLELAGKSGKVTIHLTTKKNRSITEDFYDNYLLQASFTLDNAVFSDIEANDATLASAGNNTSLTYTILPDKDADITIHALAENFHMNAIKIAGIPLSFPIDLSNTKDITKDFSKLSDGISELNDGVKKLNSGASKLSENGSKLADGSIQIKDALSSLSKSSSDITDASSQIKSALSTLATSMDSSGNTPDLSSITSLTKALDQIADGLASINVGLESLDSGFQASYDALEKAILVIPDDTLSKEDITALYTFVAKGDPTQTKTLDALVNSYQAALTVKGTYLAVKQGFDAVDATILTLTPSLTQMESSLRQMSTQLNSTLSSQDFFSQMAQLQAALKTLSENYKQFDAGLTTYMKGVTSVSTGYTSFDSGLKQYTKGISTYGKGVSKLLDGTNTLYDNTKDLPEKVDDQIKQMTSSYSGDDYQPVSFLSSKNNAIQLVQFVLQTKDIALPEKVATVTVETKKEGFFDRLLRLFQ
ncbi:MAG: putative rane protein [Clostridiales bacterium]|nr:putative rane protein [Clostridiales bacterium]